MRTTLSLLVLSVAAIAPALSATEQIPASVAMVGDAFAHDSQAYDLLTEITTRLGHRLSATTHGAAAELFAFDKLKQFGYEDVHYEAFPMLSWTRGTVSVKVDGKRIPAAALVYTPAKADVTSEIVDVGNGTAGDYSADPGKVRGKIALIYHGILPGSPAETPKLGRVARVALALQNGARGAILISPNPGNSLATGIATDTGSVVAIPVVIIGHDAGMQLRARLASHGALARIRMANTVAPGSARNVVATLKGSERPDEYILLGGHLDCLDLATGAVDDGTGSMWVLEVARGLRSMGFKPRRSIRFVLFMGEEEGMLGSYAFVQRAAADGSLGRIQYMVNTDMSMNPIGYNLWSGDPNMEFFNALAQEVRKVYPSFVTGASTGNAHGSQNSDSQPFIEHGIPIAYPTPTWAEDMLHCVHADCDTMQWVKREDLQHSAAMGAMLVAALADSSGPVAHVLSVSQTQTYLQSQGIKK